MQVVSIISPEAASMAEAFRAEGSETSDDCAERLDRLRGALEENEIGDDEVGLTLQSEYYIRCLEEAWREDAERMGDDAPTIREWALTQLTEHEFADADGCAALEAQVRALCAVLGYSYDQATKHVNRIWFTTPQGSAGLESKRTSGGTRSVPRYTTFSTPTPQKVPPTDERYTTPPRADRRADPPLAANSGGGRDPLPSAGRSKQDSAPGSPEDRARCRDEEMIRALQELSRSQEKLAQQQGQATKLTEGDDMAVTDKMNAITGFEFKQNLPVIKDTEPDLENHLREFRSLIDCHTFGKRGGASL